MADKKFYVSTETLLTVPLPRGEELRVIVGTKADGTKYVDLRTWYEDATEEMQPGKGIGKPDGQVWDAIAMAILNRNNPEQKKDLVFSMKKNDYINPEEI